MKINLILIFAFLFLFNSCSNPANEIENTPPIENVFSVERVSLETVLQDGELMFKDTELPEVLLSSARGFYINKLVDVRNLVDTPNKIKLFNAVPRNFNEVSVLFYLESVNEPIILMKLEQLPAHYNVDIDLPFSLEDKQFKTVSGKIITLENTKNLDANSYTLSLQCDDAIFNKLLEIKQQTYCQFRQYDLNNKNWAETTPEKARHYTTAIANTSYVYSSEKFKNALLNYTRILHNNKIVKDADNNIIEYTEIDRMEYLQKILNHKKWNLGVTKGVGGLGGGATFGVNGNYLINNHYERSDGNKFPLEAWAHEFSHCVGYSHKSNMTYGSSLGKYVTIFINVFKEMSENSELPFSTTLIYPQDKSTGKNLHFGKVTTAVTLCGEN